MTVTPYASGDLVALLLDYFATHAPTVGIGDGIRPDGYGWSGGQPGKGDFVPYVVLDLSGATQHEGSTLRDDQGDWDQPLLVTGFGGSRAQASWSCDQLRQVTSGLRGQSVGFKIINAAYTSLGGASRDDSTNPATWRVVDGISLRLVRE